MGDATFYFFTVKSPQSKLLASWTETKREMAFPSIKEQNANIGGLQNSDLIIENLEMVGKTSDRVKLFLLTRGFFRDVVRSVLWEWANPC